MKKTVICSIISLIVCLLFYFLIINKSYFFEKYDLNNAKIASEKKYKELSEKFERHYMLTNSDVSEMATYYYIVSEYDEGIKIFEKILKRQPNLYVTYFELSGLYAYKAQFITEIDQKKQLIETSNNYISVGLGKVPEEPLAYYLGGKAYVVLGCIERAINSFTKAIEESKNKNIVMVSEGVYLDNQKFIIFLNDEINRYKKYQSTCLLSYRSEKQK